MSRTKAEETERQEGIAREERLIAAYERMADALEAQAVVVNASFAMSKGLVAPAGAVVVAAQ